VKALRAAFLAHRPKLDPARTFFIDETGSTTAMARDYARAPRGERVLDEVPRNYGDVITIVGALTANGLTALFTYRGGTTKEAFVTYVREVLAPEQGPARARTGGECRREALLPAPLQSRLEPYRVGVVLGEALAEDGPRPNRERGQLRAAPRHGHGGCPDGVSMDPALRL
jgi:hypothetical protein